MGMFAKILSSFLQSNDQDQKANYIFYKVVDFAETTKEYVLRCINSSATFRSKITDIVFDSDILYGLHPIQACYIGIEYAKHIKSTKSSPTVHKNPKQYPASRYGAYELCYQNRKGNLCFTKVTTKETFLMDPRDIALSESLINEFDASQAFYIGLLAGLKLDNPAATIVDDHNTTFINKPQLKLIKGGLN